MATKRNDFVPRDRSRVAFERALDEIAEWRKDVADLTERHGERVFDELVDAARDAGWPESVIETTRSQVLKLSRMQSDVVGRAITAWEQQLESPYAVAPVTEPTARTVWTTRAWASWRRGSDRSTSTPDTPKRDPRTHPPGGIEARSSGGGAST